MRRRARFIVSLTVFVSALAAAPCSAIQASGTTTIVPGERAWMPDVRERLEELRERARQVALEAQLRREQQKRDGQAWRLVAARPAPEVSR